MLIERGIHVSAINRRNFRGGRRSERGGMDCETEHLSFICRSCGTRHPIRSPMAATLPTVRRPQLPRIDEDELAALEVPVAQGQKRRADANALCPKESKPCL